MEGGDVLGFRKNRTSDEGIPLGSVGLNRTMCGQDGMSNTLYEGGRQTDMMSCRLRMEARDLRWRASVARGEVPVPWEWAVRGIRRGTVVGQIPKHKEFKHICIAFEGSKQHLKWCGRPKKLYVLPIMTDGRQETSPVVSS
jgi:hypothetical protein